MIEDNGSEIRGVIDDLVLIKPIERISLLFVEHVEDGEVVGHDLVGHSVEKRSES